MSALRFSTRLAVDRFSWNSDRVVAVRDPPTDLPVPILFECLGNGVQVDFHLYNVAGALLAGLRIDDDGFVVPLGD